MIKRITDFVPRFSLADTTKQIYSRLYSFGSWNYVFYLILFLICCLLLVCAYIKIRFRFWSIQPVFHVYDFHHFMKYGVILPQLPEKNRYCNFTNIEFVELQKVTDLQKQECLHLIQSHYLSNGENKFTPSRENVMPYFVGHRAPCFFSFYYDDELLHDTSPSSTLESIDSTDSKSISRKKLVGTITTRPLHVSIFHHNQPVVAFDVYYVDYLCVDSAKRKKGIAPQLIQTHDYEERRANQKIAVSLFKRENELTCIVPLCVYKTVAFNMEKWAKPAGFVDGELTVVECGSNNMSFLIDFLRENERQFDICVLPEISNLLELVKTGNVFVWYLMEAETMTSAYFFRKTCTKLEKGHEVLCCFASIKTKDLNTETFAHGFKLALSHICEKHREFYYLSMENISHNGLLVENLLQKNRIVMETPCAYFFYNFAYPTFAGDKVLILD